VDQVPGGDFSTKPMQQSWGDGAPPGPDQGKQIDLGTVVSDIAKAAGMTASVHPTLGLLKRDYWAQSNESAIHKIQCLAQEFGGVTRVQDGNTLVLTIPGGAGSAVTVCTR
jgi:phage protein D